MEKLVFKYSYKNIPTPLERTYKLHLLDKIEQAIKRMRWKAYFYLKGNEGNSHQNETYGMRSMECPPQVRELTAFENDFLNLVKTVKFSRNSNNDFQKSLKKDIKTINSKNTTLTFADKTSNMYLLEKHQYDKLLKDSVTSNYKKASTKINEKINEKGKDLVKNKTIQNRILTNNNNECFITLKDHKENFQNVPKTRLINPAKNETGRISKVIIERINKKIRETSNYNQWRNTEEVIEWFKLLKNKNSSKFFIFDIKDFYPSISKKLFHKAINFAKKYTYISKEDIDIINHSRKSVLFCNNESWIKKGGELFDVTMGAYDGAEVCELVGLYMLDKINKVYPNSIGLYRDDGLGVFNNISGPQAEKIKKEITLIFKNENLNIEIECNKAIVNYLDIELNLSKNSYQPYHKPENEIQYIHKHSNHPPSIIKQLPLTVQTRLSNNSSSQEIFDKAAPVYQEALRKSGYEETLKFTPRNTKSEDKSRKRNIIWFNPPYNQNVTTKIGKTFLQLIDAHFGKNHKLNKIFNRNNVKVSYSCTENIKTIIDSHNKKVLNIDDNVDEKRKCNCLRKVECPLNNMCLSENIIYEAKIKSDEPNYEEKSYIGAAGTTFKLRYANHKKSFNHETYGNETELSKEVWRLKNKNNSAQISWKIIRKCPRFNRSSMKCNLCLNEKLEILSRNNTLNKRTEMISKCRHANKFKLFANDTKD